ncbi:MAG: WecB/TagA/CpsF family glycosyltransferase [Bacteroidetes bacterium]|nr:WecB/TagA/CpsF family glycosyltransferase [Bacteroidota bacterium]
MMKTESVKIFGVNINKLDDDTFLKVINDGINEKSKLCIAYANADSLNKIYSDKGLKKVYDSFGIIHPDGIGVFLASKFLYGGKGLKVRLTGSDFYGRLIKNSVHNNHSYFFFGHSDEILSEVKRANPELNIAGYQEGYNFNDDTVTDKINRLNPDIIIIGLSCPIQEKWMFKNKNRINFGIMLAVGDGIKVFAGKKIRGPVFIRKFGFEWLVRFFLDPVSNFRKYIIGNPLFVFRIIREKFKS